MEEVKHTLGKTQYLRLQGYLYDLHISDRACVFSELSGHIDGWTIRVVESKERYNTELYGSAGDWFNIRTNYVPSRTDKEMVDDIIADIEYALSKRDEKVKEAEEKRLASRKEQYEKLKKEFGDE